MPKSDWAMSRIFEDVSVAKEWRFTPEAFWDLSKEERALMIAFERVKSTISAVEAEEAKRHAKQ